MKILIAIDSFKGSISSLDAGNAVKSGVLAACPDADVSVFPIADGGEGTVEAIVTAQNGRYVEAETVDPLGRSIRAVYGIVGGDTAVIEMSAAAGLPMVDGRKNPLITTTYGVGQLIDHAINNGCKKVNKVDIPR